MLSGNGSITGELLGGCLDVFPMIIGTEVWPERDEWKNKILLVETSEEKPSPDLMTYYLRNLGTQGILNWLQNSRNIRYFIESVTVLTVCNSKRL